MNGKLSPFKRTTLDLKPREFLSEMMGNGFSRSDAKRALRKLQLDEVFVNDTYQVNVDRGASHGFPSWLVVIHLSIKRRDKQAFDDWRDIQAIKNAILGPDFEALELYPSEARLVDTANQRHLWALAKAGQGSELVPVRAPLGWTGPREVSGEGRFGAVQRALS